MPNNRGTRRSFGAIRQLPSGRYQCRYIGPDAVEYRAPRTFSTHDDAAAWCAAERRLIDLDVWTPPAEREAKKVASESTVTVQQFAEKWLDHRAKPLTPKTRAHYVSVLDAKIYPVLGDLDIRGVTKNVVAVWYAGLDHSKATATAHAYQVLRALMNGAVEAGVVPENPCQIKDAGRTKTRRNLDLLSAAELTTVTELMPKRYRAAVLVAAWAGLRFGELTELRRRDLTNNGTVLRIRRAVTFIPEQGFIVGKPKSEEGVRDVTLPPHIVPILAEHVEQFAAAGRDGLIFTNTKGERVSQSAFTKPFKDALKTIDRAEVRVHDLRHYGAVAAAQAGGTTRELMARLGHSTPEMSMRYQHAAAGRDAEIAERMSKMIEERPSE